jgi:hypothetical protein
VCFRASSSCCVHSLAVTEDKLKDINKKEEENLPMNMKLRMYYLKK